LGMWDDPHVLGARDLADRVRDLLLDLLARLPPDYPAGAHVSAVTKFHATLRRLVRRLPGYVAHETVNHRMVPLGPWKRSRRTVNTPQGITLLGRGTVVRGFSAGATVPWALALSG
jgi:hypothetical protein